MTAMRYVGNEVAGVATRVRAELIKNLLNVNWGYFTHQPLGRIANAVSIEASRSGEAYLMAANFHAPAIQSVVYTLLAMPASLQQAVAPSTLAGSKPFAL